MNAKQPIPIRGNRCPSCGETLKCALCRGEVGRGSVRSLNEDHICNRCQPLPLATPTAPDSRIALSLDEAAEALGFSRAGIYLLAKNEGLPLRKLGARRVVVRAELEAWLKEHDS